MKREEKRRLLLSDTGQYITKIQEDLVDEFHYKKLDDKLAIEYMRKYVLSLPEGFRLEHNEIPVPLNPEINYTINKPGFEIIKENKFPLLSRTGMLISNGFERIVLGHYGAFIEIDEKDIYEKNLILETGQEYRMYDRRYKDKVKYVWLTTRDESCCKIYLQQREVSYADYRVDMYYISPFEVLDYNELTNFLMNEGEEDE